VDDIYLSREVFSRLGPDAIRCVPGGGIQYRPPETLRGMFRKYQRMRLEIERIHCFFPPSRAVHQRWGRRRLDRGRLAAAPLREKLYYGLFWLALCLCKLAYHAQKFYYTSLSHRDCPTWAPVVETKYTISQILPPIQKQPLPNGRGSDPSRARQQAVVRHVGKLLGWRTKERMQ
jgi:hypothetical protein